MPVMRRRCRWMHLQRSDLGVQGMVAVNIGSAFELAAHRPCGTALHACRDTIGPGHIIMVRRRPRCLIYDLNSLRKGSRAQGTMQDGQILHANTCISGLQISVSDHDALRVDANKRETPGEGQAPGLGSVLGLPVDQADERHVVGVKIPRLPQQQMSGSNSVARDNLSFAI